MRSICTTHTFTELLTNRITVARHRGIKTAHPVFGDLLAFLRKAIDLHGRKKYHSLYVVFSGNVQYIFCALNCNIDGIRRVIQKESAGCWICTMHNIINTDRYLWGTGNIAFHKLQFRCIFKKQLCLFSITHPQNDPQVQIVTAVCVQKSPHKRSTNQTGCTRYQKDRIPKAFRIDGVPDAFRILQKNISTCFFATHLNPSPAYPKICEFSLASSNARNI